VADKFPVKLRQASQGMKHELLSSVTQTGYSAILKYLFTVVSLEGKD